eukprot:CAMPEP_0202891828 /NCGR_PEP_ID=MMETSP1392-20130828/1781_1 /ASSEMBLY_ACC=CAM_ASM_000868 /TAXON_ID=225041 /ORGANISM="Chlamydomonas chlamydogama, Strain SAG 11-48b" /LENGTH=445 /DNA_ID=CAMNT_0049575687 /DNA_START=22 /DNA_END=1359 /DNA_ORIENTATION=+
MALMTKEALKAICAEHKLYRTPSLNDKLYCNFKGFTHIACLEEYTALRALFLEGNAIDSLEGLPALQELRCLYLQQNCLWRITDLEGLQNLDTINISNNLITKLENLSCCPVLRTLICTNNRLESVDSVAHLAECTALTTVDLQNNTLSDPAILDILKQLPELKCLYLKGNPVVSKMKNYRKTVIAALPTLTYLDDRPVFEQERRLVNAWVSGGLEGERQERARIREEEDAANKRNFEAMQELRKAGWKKKREMLGLPAGDSDPALEELSDEEYQFLEEPPELVAARERLAAYTAREGEEEPPELAEARHKLVKGGAPVLPATFSSAAENDGDIYLASVRQSQHESGMLSSNASSGAAAPARPSAAAKFPPSSSGNDASPPQDSDKSSRASSGGSPTKIAVVSREGDDASLPQDAGKAARAAADMPPLEPVPVEEGGQVDLEELD